MISTSAGGVCASNGRAATANARAPRFIPIPIMDRRRNLWVAGWLHATLDSLEVDIHGREDAGPWLFSVSGRGRLLVGRVAGAAGLVHFLELFGEAGRV